MYNLSDKELDRLSREAASQHDPGDLMGPGGWDRLELHLDRELGKAPTPSSRPNPVRGIRRIPFQYATVIAVILGVSYFAVRQMTKAKKAEPSAGPPLSSVSPAKQNSSSNNPDHKENSTPSTNSPKADSVNTVPYSAGLPANGTPNPSANGTSNSSANSPTHDHSTARPPVPGVNTKDTYHTAGNNTALKGSHNNAGNNTTPKPNDNNTINSTTLKAGRNSTANSTILKSGHNNTGSNANVTSSFNTLAHKNRPRNNNGGNTSAGKKPSALENATNEASTGPLANSNTLSNSPNQTSSVAKRNAATSYPSLIPSAKPRLRRPAANDSALLAYGQQAAAPKKETRQLHINRSLQIGLQLAPDFTSVNALAGDKPGSSIGVTVDYQILNRFYIGSGVLLSKKNYSARVQDCHMPNDYFRANNLHNVDFVKGSLNMLEIPLNFRYDFSVTGNTMFFASAGTSSYISLSQRNDYYYDFFGREAYRRFKYDQKNAYLFSSVNLSLGVETGLSNSLSLLIAPYVKLPSRSIGFGEFKMSSVGVNFALKFAPILSRTRK